MFGRMGRVIGPLIALLIIGLVAAVAFSLGQASVPIGTAVAPSGAAVPVYVGHYGWGGFGFGFLGFLFPLFFIFLLIWALRPRGGGWGGYRGHGYGPGYGRGWGRGYWGEPGKPGPEGEGSENDPWTARRHALEELHRQLHEAEKSGSSGSSGGGSSPETPTTL